MGASVDLDRCRGVVRIVAEARIRPRCSRRGRDPLLAISSTRNESRPTAFGGTSPAVSNTRDGSRPTAMRNPAQGWSCAATQTLGSSLHSTASRKRSEGARDSVRQPPRTSNPTSHASIAREGLCAPGVFDEEPRAHCPSGPAPRTPRLHGRNPSRDGLRSHRDQYRARSRPCAFQSRTDEAVERCRGPSKEGFDELAACATDEPRELPLAKRLWGLFGQPVPTGGGDRLHSESKGTPSGRHVSRGVQKVPDSPRDRMGRDVCLGLRGRATRQAMMDRRTTS